MRKSNVESYKVITNLIIFLAKTGNQTAADFLNYQETHFEMSDKNTLAMVQRYPWAK